MWFLGYERDFHLCVMTIAAEKRPKRAVKMKIIPGVELVAVAVLKATKG